MLSAKLKEAAGNGIASTLYVDSVFSTYLYTGNGSTQTITNGIDLAGKGGMVWVKNRTNAIQHFLFDTDRGMGFSISPPFLSSNTTDAQSTTSTNYIKSDATGFSYGTLASGSAVNATGINYASWTFRKAAKFFDVVTWTGNGTTSQTINHSLGSIPGMIIVKVTNTVGEWAVYHRDLGNQYYLWLSSTTAKDGPNINYWNNTSPTASDFTVGANFSTAGITYVAYLFAHDTSSTGIIQCGSFTTGASGGATVSSLGWEPQFLLVKRTVGVASWTMFDSMRGLTASASSAVLYPNLSNSETVGDYMTPTANGFIMPPGVWSGTSGESFIYMAIRMPNKPPTSGTQVFSPVLNTGNEVTKTVGSTDFPVDLLIAPARTGGSISRWVNDRLRGRLPTLNSSSTDAEFDFSSGYGIGFDQQSGVKVYLSTDNTNIHTYVNYMFKRAPGFFDVVCYTGTGSATTQAHNLGVAPELLIVKERSAANDWWVYNATVGNTKYSVLNSTAIPVTSSTAWNNTTPTSSVFSIGTGANVNASTQTYVAYLFATLAGISKVGSYTGNGTTQNIDCGFAAGARFFLVKATSTTGSWWVWDSARGIVAGNDPALQLNSTAAEITTADAVDPYSPGITVNQEATCSINASGVSYIFLAVA